MTGHRRTNVVRVVAVAVAVTAIVWRLTDTGDSGFERPIVLASGRDDHGLLASPAVALLDAPDGDQVASVDDGTLVEVLEEQATWLRVAALDGDGATGWVDDFHLRGTAHVVGDPPACPVATYGELGERVLGELAPSTQVELLDHHVMGSGPWVAVRPLDEGELVLVPAATVHELPGPAPVAGQACEDVQPDPLARPHRH